MRIIISAILLFISTICSSQTTAEWLNQKETKKKYLLQQIAALKMYLGYAEKGYNIANKGLQTIHFIKKGDFSLHNDFFNSLKTVNPAIARWSRLTDIISLQIKIVKQSKEVLSSIKESNQFTPGETNYCNSVFDHLLEACLQNMDDLVTVTTSGELEMKDDERIKRIESIFLDMQDKFAFCSSFAGDIKLLSLQRTNDKKEIELSRILNK